MVSRFAMMLEGAPNGLHGRRRPLAEHVTCRSCGGHHALSLAPFAPNKSPDEAPTHQCRDCGFQWTDFNSL
jgi:ribosomal protein L37E